MFYLANMYADFVYDNKAIKDTSDANEDGLLRYNYAPAAKVYQWRWTTVR